MCSELKSKKDLVEYKQRKTVKQIHNMTSILQKERTQSQCDMDLIISNPAKRREIINKIFADQSKLDSNINMVLNLIAKFTPI